MGVMMEIRNDAQLKQLPTDAIIVGYGNTAAPWVSVKRKAGWWLNANNTGVIPHNWTYRPENYKLIWKNEPPQPPGFIWWGWLDDQPDGSIVAVDYASGPAICVKFGRFWNVCQMDYRSTRMSSVKLSKKTGFRILHIPHLIDNGTSVELGTQIPNESAGPVSNPHNPL